jgi:hypothetical protein
MGVFGGPAKNGKSDEPARAAASEVARLAGGGLVQVVVTGLDPMEFFLFLNDRAVAQTDVESLLVTIEVPESGNLEQGTASATLSQFVKAVTGERSSQTVELFPCTLELVALGRRITVTCSQPNSLEGVWIGLGLKPDGSSAEVTGARSLRILLADGILDAHLTWMDGETEDLLQARTE